MKTTILRLRQLIRETMSMPPTVRPGKGNNGSGSGEYTGMGPRRTKSGEFQIDDPIDNKVDLVVRQLTKMGHHIDPKQVAQYVNGLTPERALVLTADDIAAALVKKTAH